MRKEQRITVDVDWTRVPAGLTQVELTVNGPNKAKVVVHVPVHAPAGLHAETLRGHVETGGVVAMEAEHYSRASAPAGRHWQTIPGYGHTLSGVTPMPAAMPAMSPREGMRLEYDVHLASSGELDPGLVFNVSSSTLAGSGQATLGRRKAPTLRRRPGDRIAA